MRKITHDSLDALFTRRDFRRGNMRVENSSHTSFLYLHDNCIARIHWTSLPHFPLVEISACGWETATTKERLNGLIDRLNSLGWADSAIPYIFQENFKWYFWTAEKTRDCLPFPSGTIVLLWRNDAHKDGGYLNWVHYALLS